MKKHSTLFFVWVNFLLIFSFCTTSSDQNSDKRQSSIHLQTITDGYLSGKNDVLGTIVWVDINGKSYKTSNGYFDISQKTPIKPNHKFIIGSITKVFTAVLVHQLVESGKVKLKIPLIDYLSQDWQDILNDIKYGREITVEHALSHRSGIFDVTNADVFWEKLLSDPSHNWTPVEVLRLVQKEGKPLFRPGSRFSYSNINYVLLGALIENVSQKSYAEALQENIISKIGINNTFISEGPFGSNKGGIAHGYYRLDDKIYDGQDANSGWAMASGGIISNADDLSTFFKALISSRLFNKKETFQKMCQRIGRNKSYGLGIEVIEDSEIGLYYAHKGNFCNTRSIICYFPQNNTIIIVVHTFNSSATFLYPESLVKLIVKKMIKKESIDKGSATKVNSGIITDTVEVITNKDVPAKGEWDFSPKELWHIDHIGNYSLKNVKDIKISKEERIYLLEGKSAKIFVLDSDGKILFYFGGWGEEEKFEYPSTIYLTSDHIIVRDIDNELKFFTKKGVLENIYEPGMDIIPRVFFDSTHYLTVRSNIEKKLTHETLELYNLGQKKTIIFKRISAESKLVVSGKVKRGRIRVLINDVETYAKAIIHVNNNKILFGISDEYLIKRIKLNGEVEVAFSITGRKRKAVPTQYKEDHVEDMRFSGEIKLPQDMKRKIKADYPDKCTFFKKIIADEDGMIYVFVSDVTSKGEQEIDIFSPEGEYLYHANLDFAEDYQILKSCQFRGEHLYIQVESKNGERKLIKFKVKRPVL